MSTLDFVSLFAGAGGLDLGLEEGGWRCLYAADIDENAIASIEANRGLTLHEANKRAFEATIAEVADLRDQTAENLLAKIGCSRGDIPLLAGGPPCQSWSSAGHQHGLNDPRGHLFQDFVRLANGLDTRWLLFENVRGLLTARGPDGMPGSALALIRRHLLEAGYQTSVGLLNAADYGVPQRRVRLFIVGFREGDAPPFPAPTHVKDCDLACDGKLRWVTLGECLRSIQPPIASDEVIRPTGKMADELASIPAGSGVKSKGKREATRPGGHWGYKQGAFVADLEKAARTVTASGQQDWIRDPEFGLRRLCPRECAAIQTFPEDWILEGKRSVQYRLIGNAVPPLLASSIGKSLAEFALLNEDGGHERPDLQNTESLFPLSENLQAAISYTMREELANGESRRKSQSKRKSRIELTPFSPDSLTA